MDPIGGINIKKDSTFAMLLEAQRRGHELVYMEPADLYVEDGTAMANMRPVSVRDDAAGWFELGAGKARPLGELDIILMRRDPPFDLDYIYLTYILELAEAAGALVINRPGALRDANEKFFITHFPQCCVPMVITREMATIRAFVAEHGRSVVKPLDGMGGDSVFQLRPGDANNNVILESITDKERELVMVQRYIEEISAGDRRILMVNGQPVPYALARFPGEGDFRGNLAKGGTGRGEPLKERDYWICEQVGPELERRGILFAGLDVIGDWLSEVNVTSPTCIRELDREFGLNIAGQMFDAAEARLNA
ncbi:MAG: glutathione synthase [Xanthomonadales bacterium]|nr:glutathione synthase [Xanthomonadales bacterium]